MKGLNKLALATAVAAAPFATQAMEPMSESEMGNTTGQAGVTIELNTEMSIGQIGYSQGENTGSVLVNNVEVGGMGTNADLGYGDGLDMEINVDLAEQDDTLQQYGSKAGSALGGEDLTLNDGDALISIQNYNSPATTGTDNDGNPVEEPVPVDMRVELGANGGNDAFQLSDSAGNNKATLMSNLKMDVFLSQLDIIARNGAATDADGNATVGNSDHGAIEIEAGFAIDDLDADFDVASVGIQDMQLAGNQAFEAGVLGSDGSSSQGDGSVLDAGAAIVSMDIGQGEALSGESTAGGETLRVDLANFKADIWMDTINVGGGSSASIGSVAIDNLNVKNTQMAIYGRD